MGFEVVTIKSIVNAYLLIGEQVLLVDTLDSRSFGKLEHAFKEKSISPGDIDLIFITHYHSDHIGNLAKLKEVSGATVMAGAADAPVIEGNEPPAPPGDLSRGGRIARKVPNSLWVKYSSSKPAVVDRAVSDGDRIEEMGLEVISLPGHTRGGVGLHDTRGRRAFTGDLVSNYRGRLGMPFMIASYNLQEILASQAKIASLDADVIYPGHGKIISPDASSRVGEMVRENRIKYFQTGHAGF